MAEIPTVCPFCGCGCGVYVHVRDGRAVGVSPGRSHPVSQGRICQKGWHAHELTDNPRRLTRPLLRRDGELVEVSWEEALAAASRGLKEIAQASGPSAIGVLGSARCTNEDDYCLVRFARGTLGTPNLDCSLSIQCLPELRPQDLCLSPAPSAPLRTSASAGQISDLDLSDLILVVGDDPGEEHPAIAARLYRARLRGAHIVTASLRRHTLARLSEIYLPLRPGQEVRLLGSLLYVLLVEEGMARDAGDDIGALRASVAGLSPEDTQAETGVPAETVRRVARLYLNSKQVAILYSTGLTLSALGAQAVRTLTCLAALGSSARGARVVLLSLTSRNNLQGCRDMGVAPDYLPGYGELDSDESVGRFEQAWQCRLARGKGLRAWEMPGRVQAMYVMGDDIIRSSADAAQTRAALESLKLLIVQDIFLSPVASLAHVVLPAAAFPERDGTTTSLERRVQLVRRAVAPSGEAREDWRIIAELSRALGKPFPYQDARQIFEEIAQLLPIYSGVLYPPLEVHGGIRWPTAGAREAGRGPAPSSAARLGEALAGSAGAGDPKLKTTEQYPLLLAADPTFRPWDGETTVCQAMTLGEEFSVIERDYPDGMLCLSPDDAKRCGVRGGRGARVSSAKGERKMRVLVSDEVPEGIAILPYTQAARSGLLEIAANPDTGRPVLLPTPVSVAPAE